MKRATFVFSLIAGLAIYSIALATPSQQVTKNLIGRGVPDSVAAYLAQLFASAPKINSNTFLKVRNAADSADLSVLKSDASDNTVINAGTGKTINLQINSTTVASVNGTGLSVVGLQFPTANEEAVAAAGSVQGDAAALSSTKFLHQVTGADGTKGVILPATTVAGTTHWFLNTTAGVLKIYPATGGTINGAAANAALSFLTGILPHLCYATAADTWICA